MHKQTVTLLGATLLVVCCIRLGEAYPGPQLKDMVLAGGQRALSSVTDISTLWNDCKKAQRVFATDPGVAAMLFTDEGCENTKIQVREGFTELPIHKRNRAEAVVVRPGCICVGFDHSDKSGRSAVFDNVKGGSKYLILKDLKDSQLDEAISSVDCRCGRAAEPANRTPVVQMTSAVSQKGCGGSCRDRCNRHVGQFNRVDLPSGKKVCAMLFDEHDCKDWSKPVLEGFNIFPRMSRYRNDAGSVMVRPGCTLTGYDNANKSGNRVVVDSAGQGTASQPVFKNLKGRNDLEDRISAVECTCRG